MKTISVKKEREIRKVGNIAIIDKAQRKKVEPPKGPTVEEKSLKALEKIFVAITAIYHKTDKSPDFTGVLNSLKNQNSAEIGKALKAIESAIGKIKPPKSAEVIELENVRRDPTGRITDGTRLVVKKWKT